jgi:hypothetical protein
MEPRTVIYEPPPMPEPAFVEGVRPISMPPPAPSSAPAPTPAPPAAGVLRKPEHEIKNVDWLAPRPEPTAPPGSAFKRFLRYLAAFLGLALIVAWMFAPAIARAWIVTGAAARGLVVTIDRVDVSRRAIRLGDVHVESTEFPGATMHAGALVIGLRWLVPERVTIDDGEIALDGSYSEMESRLAQYRAKYAASIAEASGGIKRIEVTSGRIDWKNVVGTGTSALVENITVDATKNAIRPLGDDYHLSAPLFTMKIAGAPAGPWQLDVDRSGILVRSIVRFDPSGTYPASVTRTSADDGSVSLALAIPPTSLTYLHIPAAALGKLATDRTRIEGHGEIQIDAVQQATTRGGDASAPAATSSALPTPADAGSVVPTAGGSAVARSASGHLVIGAQAIAVFLGGAPVDLSLDIPVQGDASRPIPIAGAVLSLGPADPTGGSPPNVASAAMTGTLDVSRPTTRLELAGKTGAIACAKPAGPSTGGPLAKQAPTTGVVATIAVTLDDYPGTKVTFQPVGACVPKLR